MLRFKLNQKIAILVLSMPSLMVSCGDKTADSKTESEQNSVESHAEFIDVRAVFNHVEENFKIYTSEEVREIQLEKRRDGYFLVTKSYNDQTKRTEVLNAILIWSPENGFSDESQIDEAPFHNAQPLSLRSDDFTVKKFNQSPFFNYEGWYNDVIAYFESNPAQTAEQLNAKARAMDVKLINELTCGQYGNSVESDCFKTSKDYGNEAISDEEAEDYKKRLFKVADAFDAVAQKDPNYQVIVGNIRIKRANTYVMGYLDMLQYKNESFAKSFLLANIYPEYIVENAKNYLSACPPNAILFTHGDNDTYPLLYVQAFENHRPDVTVLNSSLMNLYRYVHTYENSVNGALPLNLTLQDKFYTKGNDQFLTWAREEPRASNVDLNHLESDWEQLISEKTIKAIPQLKVERSDSVNGESQTYVWKDKKNYLIFADLVFWDIIANNKRPICVANSGGPNSFHGMKNYFKYVGYVNILAPASEKNEETTITVDSETLANNVQHVFADSKVLSSQDEHHTIRGIKTQVMYDFIRLAGTYKEDGDTAKSHAMLLEIENRFSKDDFVYFITLDYRISNLIALDDENQALKLIDILINRMETTVKAELEDDFSSHDLYQWENYMNRMKFLSESLANSESPDLNARAEKVLMARSNTIQRINEYIATDEAFKYNQQEIKD